MVEFRTVLEHTLQGPLAQLRIAAYASPPLRRYVERAQKDTATMRRTGIYPFELTRSPWDARETLQGQLL